MPIISSKIQYYDMATQTNQLRWIWLTALVIAIDLACKYFVTQFYIPYQSTYLLPFINIVLSHNLGASFGFLHNAGGWQRWLFILIAVVISLFIIVALYRMKRKDNLTACAFALILAGAIGNLYNRFVLGYVIDFVDLHIGNLHFPAYFNIADLAINIGVALWLIKLLTDKKSESKF
jgi:signal peptidase II